MVANDEPARRFGAIAAAVAGALPPERATGFRDRLGVGGLMRRLGVWPPRPDDAARDTSARLYVRLLLERADAISAALRSAGVAHFFMKGAALADTAYRPGERLFSDIDLHVRRAQRDEAVSVLAQLGFTPLEERAQAGPPALRSTRALTAAAEPPVGVVMVDLHWGVDPVDRLLPRGDRSLPERVWRDVDAGASRPVPSAPHHAALLAHHLVHSDLLHVRGVVDLTLVLSTLRDDDALEYLATCADFGVRRFGAAVARMVARDLGAPIAGGLRARGALADPPRMRGFTIERWLRLVAETDAEDKERITLVRIRRRLGLIDRPRFWTVTADAWWPPNAFLEWRWGRPLWRARVRHAGQIMRKVVTGRG